MRGHIARKSGRWYPVTEARNETGARKRQWHPGHDTKREAAKALTALLGSIDGGTYVEPSRRTLGTFLTDEWLPAVESSLRASTYSSYKWQIATHIAPRLGHVSLQHLTAPKLNAAYGEMLRAGRRNGKGGLSPRSVRYTHQIVRKALADAVKWNLLVRNPADAANPPSTATPEMKTWNTDELHAFLDRVQDDRLYALWVLASTRGLRRGELLGLPWRNVDLDSGSIAITQSLVNVYGRAEFSKPKTKRSRRLVKIGSGTTAALREHRERQGLEQSFMGEAWQGNDLVFCREDGSPIHPYALSQTFGRHVRDAGLPPLSVHGLRHTCATLALGKGVHPKVVSEWLGHSSIAITMDTYSHALPTVEESAAELMDAEILGLRVEDR